VAKKRLNVPYPGDLNYVGPGVRGLYTRDLIERIRKLYGKDTEVQFEIQDDENQLYIYDGEKTIGMYEIEGKPNMRNWIFLEDETIKDMIESSFKDTCSWEHHIKSIINSCSTS